MFSRHTSHVGRRPYVAYAGAGTMLRLLYILMYILMPHMRAHLCMPTERLGLRLLQ
jgi:hypothetical protein